MQETLLYLRLKHFFNIDLKRCEAINVGRHALNQLLEYRYLCLLNHTFDLSEKNDKEVHFQLMSLPI